MKILFACLSSVLIFCNCQRPTDNNFKGLRISIREENFTKGNTNLSSLIKVTELIPLETTPVSLIGKIDKVIISNNRIYVLDNRRARSVFIFDRKGTFVNKIESTGKGPMDINEPSDIGIHPLTNDLVILDESLRKINSYDQNGNYHWSKGLNFTSAHFEFLGENKIVFSTMMPYQVHLTNLDGEILRTYLKYDPNFAWELVKPLISYKNQIFYMRFLDDTLYQIDENQLTSTLYIDFGKRQLSRKDYLKLPIYDGERQIGPESVRGIYIPGINKTHFIFLFALNGKAYYNIYNRNDDQLFTVAYLDIKDDLFSGGATTIFFNNTFDDHFIGQIEPSRMKPLIPIAYNQSKYNVAADDNPVLFLYDIKK